MEIIQDFIVLSLTKFNMLYFKIYSNFINKSKPKILKLIDLNPY